MSRILGIDPGSQFLGLACVESRGSSLVCIGHAAVKVDGPPGEAWTLRLKRIFQAVDEKIALWRPDTCAAEEVFFSKNAQSALKLGQARGAALAAVVMQGISVSEYPATKIKQSLTGSGRADKTQVESLVKLILGASLREAGEFTRHDASDALAIAICHAQQSRSAGLIRLGSPPPLG